MYAAWLSDNCPSNNCLGLYFVIHADIESGLLVQLGVRLGLKLGRVSPGMKLRIFSIVRAILHTVHVHLEHISKFNF